MYCKISAESLSLRGTSNYWLPIAFVGAAHALRGCGKGPGLCYSGTWHLLFLYSSFTCKTSPICFWLLCYEALVWLVKIVTAAWSPCDLREFFLWSLVLHWILTLGTCPPKTAKSVSLISIPGSPSVSSITAFTLFLSCLPGFFIFLWAS